jgi:spoIIIJ-associated protein
MIREAIGSGETVLAAQEAACRELGVETHEAEFEVLQMPEKKKLGLFGGCPARVRAYLVITPAQVAEDYLRGVIEGMGVGDIQIAAEQTEEGVVFNLSGEHVGYLIGRRGETMDALQYLTGLVANHVENSYYRVTLNTGNYREKREKTLEVLARKMAVKAVRTGYSTALEPMNPYERRIIHTAVQKVAGAASWSEGEDMNRHVVIGVDPKAKPSVRGGNYRRPAGGRPGYDNRPRGDKRPGPKPVKEAAAPQAGAEPKKEAHVAPLYGKIEPKK